MSNFFLDEEQKGAGIQLRSLVISKQSLVLEWVRGFLEGRGHQVFTHENFPSAMFTKHMDPFDLVVIDHEAITLEEIRKYCMTLHFLSPGFFSREKKAVVLALVAEENLQEAQQLIDTGVDDVVGKPLKEQEMHPRLTTLENLIRLRHRNRIAEENLQQAIAHCGDLTENIPGVVFQLSTNEQNAKHELQYVGERVQSLFGFHSKEIFQSPVLLISEFPEALQAQFSNTASNTPAHTQRFQFYSERTNRWIELMIDCHRSSEQHITWNGFAMDSTDKKEAEERLRKSEESFRTLIESAPDAVFVHREGRCVYANPSAVKQFGYTAMDEMIGESSLKWVHEEDQELVRERQRDFIQQGKKAPAKEMRFVRRHGEIFSAEVVSIPVMYSGESSILVIMRDLSERKELQSRLMFADRMASVGTLAAGVAHELNNPLAYVLSNLKLMKEELDLNGDRGTYDRLKPILELIEESIHGAERMGHIVRDLKTFSRVDDERMGAINIEESLESSINMCANEIRHRATLIKNIQTTPPVKINEGRLGQIFLNLLVNAVQALPENSSSENKVEIHANTDEQGWAQVQIVDNGDGIAMETMDRMYEPFFTTKGKVEGTGLGLSICRNIIERAGGVIHCESQVGLGTTFTVRLPPCQQKIRVSSSPPPSLISEVPPRMKILIIDDEERVARSLKRTLRHHDVKVFNSGRKAADFLIGGGNFDIILCDIMMPGVSGVDLYYKVKEHRPEIANRFVFMTGGAFTTQARAFLESLPYEYIEKPFDLAQVRRIVKERAGMLYEPTESGSFQKPPLPNFLEEEALNS